MIAALGFLGLGATLGNWAVDTIRGAVRPPEGFDELYSAWQDTANLSNSLLTTGEETNRFLAKGFSSPGLREPPPELQGRREKLRSVRYSASELTGRLRSINTNLSGPRDDLVQLTVLIRDTAELIDTAVMDAYIEYDGSPIYGGSAGFQPVFTNELRESVSKQNLLAGQVAAGLRPTAQRFKHPLPVIRGWNHLCYDQVNDTPNY